MGIFGRRRKEIDGNGGQPGLAGDALRMRAALAAMVAERRRLRSGAALDLRALVDDLLTGEVESPTPDVAWLLEHHVDPGAFYEKEIAPSWEGLSEAQRAARLDGFLDLARMLDEQGDAAGLPEEMAATVHTKTLLLAFAFDETHGYISQIASGK